MLRAFSGSSLAGRLGWPLISRTANFNHANSNSNSQTRCFMSPAFACREAWESRLDSPVFHKLEMEQFFYEVEKKFARENRGSAIDVDLFAQAAKGETQMDQLEELLHQFRRTPQTVTTLASTPHAVVRALLAEDRSDNLMRILDDPLNYGLFPDDYCLVYMMDHYLEAENWRDASKVAIHMMLQENLAVPVAREMAALACYKYAVTGEPKPWEPQAPEREEEPEEDVKVHVEWAPNNYHDDHFDLDGHRDLLLGKTLYKLASAKPTGQEDADKALMILGLTLFEKWDKLLSVLESPGATPHFSAECLQKVKDLVSSASEEKVPFKSKLEEILSGFDIVEEDRAHDLLRERVQSAAAEHESDYVARQTELYEKWSQMREKELERQFQLYQAESRKEEVERKLSAFEGDEKRLFFFDRQEEFEQIKADKEKEWASKLPPRTWTRRITLKKKETSFKESYIPPDVSGRKMS